MNIKHFSFKNLCFVETEINLKEIDYFGTIQNSGFIKMKSGEMLEYIERPFIVPLVRNLLLNNIKTKSEWNGSVRIFFVIK